MPNVDPGHTTHWTCNYGADTGSLCCYCVGHKCLDPNSHMKKTIVGKSNIKEEWWGYVYICLICKSEEIWKDFKYCPNCGLEIDWKV